MSIFLWRTPTLCVDKNKKSVERNIPPTSPGHDSRLHFLSTNAPLTRLEETCTRKDTKTSTPPLAARGGPRHCKDSSSRFSRKNHLDLLEHVSSRFAAQSVPHGTRDGRHDVDSLSVLDRRLCVAISPLCTRFLGGALSPSTTIFD